MRWLNEIFGPEVLSRARIAVGDRNAFDADQLGRWKVRALFNRDRSTVARLEIRGPDGPIVVYAKREGRADENTDLERLALRRERLRYGFRALQTMAPQLTKIGVQVPTPLAIDEDFFTTVALEVPGRPLGRTFTNLCRRPGPSVIAARFEHLGRAFRLLDDHGLSQDEIAPPETLAERLDRLIGQLAPHVPESILEAVESSAGGVIGRLGPSAKLVPVHRDPSSTNILVSRDGIGLIDFSWAFAYPGFDLYYLQYRLKRDRPQLHRWSESLGRRLRHGYGTVDRQHRGLLHLAELERRARPVIRSSGSRPAVDDLQRAMRSAEEWLNP